MLRSAAHKRQLDPIVDQIERVAPAAAGAGVTLVMAFLNGNYIPALYSLRTLLMKALGTVIGTSAGFSLGPEGPLVYLGASTAAILSRMDVGE